MRIPSRSGCNNTNPALAHKQAMKVVQDVLSPEAALIAQKIPRIEPMLRMIENNGFIVVGLNEEPEIENPIFKEPVQLNGTSRGISRLNQLLLKRGYQVARNAAPQDSKKAVQE